jgi:DNA-damage-inducible protein D
MSSIKLFESRQVRTIWSEAEHKWYFVITDVVQVLTDTSNAADYIKKMRRRDTILSQAWPSFIKKFEFDTEGGKQELNCASAQALLRIIQSIPSPKAEPFKLWLAQVGNERLEEIENPELATQRTREFYKLKGYPNDWIEKRMRSIAIREELTDEWSNRGVKEKKNYAILTAEISKATFGITPSEHRKVKGLRRENLRDHMNDLELIFSMLGEASTTAIVKTRDPQGFVENRSVAKQGGSVAGKARRDLEKKTGKKVVSPKNYLPNSKKGEPPKLK